MLILFLVPRDKETMSHRPKPLVSLPLNGFGCSPAQENNAIAMANTACWDRLQQYYPMTLSNGSGNSVGLPNEQMGNSEEGRILVPSPQKVGGQLLLTADHGNIE
ncbi:MAG: hypothetical protein PHR16_14160 [Methylovulum sp.]|nr:hypothetical protein [Methylovulum sp.]